MMQQEHYNCEKKRKEKTFDFENIVNFNTTHFSISQYFSLLTLTSLYTWHYSIEMNEIIIKKKKMFQYLPYTPKRVYGSIPIETNKGIIMLMHLRNIIISVLYILLHIETKLNPSLIRYNINMPKLYPRYAQNMFKYAKKNRPRIYPRFAKYIAKIFQRYAQDMPKLGPR